MLCAVFARTLEDRGFLPHRLAGPGAVDRFNQFRAQFKFLGERDYLLHVFDAIALLPAGSDVFGVAHAFKLIDGAKGKMGPIEQKWSVDIELKEADYDACLSLLGGLFQ